MQLFTFKLSTRTPLPVATGADVEAAWPDFLAFSFHTIPVRRNFQTGLDRPRWTPLRPGLAAHLRAPEDSLRELLREQGALLILREAERGREALFPTVLPAELLRENGQMLRLMLSSVEPLLLLLRSFFLSFSSGFCSPTALNKSFQRLELDVGEDERMEDGGKSTGRLTVG